MSKQKRKKVLTSGCFDLLHSGHIEFFKQASQHGDLFVRLGTDANIRLLKQHEPMYSDQERLFMVRSICYVHDAALSCGVGRFDFFEDFQVIQPDIYYCNEDASDLQTRIAYCKDNGIEIIVAKRNPADGLIERSSTSIKERLKEMVQAEIIEELNKMNNNIININKSNTDTSKILSAITIVDTNRTNISSPNSDLSPNESSHSINGNNTKKNISDHRGENTQSASSLQRKLREAVSKQRMLQLSDDQIQIQNQNSNQLTTLPSFSSKSVTSHVYSYNPSPLVSSRIQSGIQSAALENDNFQQPFPINSFFIDNRSPSNKIRRTSDFNQSFPWRLCVGGGWMDLKWCNELHHGSVVTINIKYHPGIQQSCICKDMCGLATSSRKVALKLWNGCIPNHLHAVDAAKYLFGAENFNHFGKFTGLLPEWEKRSYSAGSQDHLGLFLPGQHWPTSIINYSDIRNEQHLKIFKWLETVVYIVEIPFTARPENYNSQKINNLTDETIPLESRVALSKALADASELVWHGIKNMDTIALGLGWHNTMQAWSKMLPYTVDPYLDTDPVKSKELKDFWRKYDTPFTNGCLFSGAGGGFLFVSSDYPIEGGMRITVNHDPIVKPFVTDTSGNVATTS